MQKNTIHIKYLDLGHNLVIENDELKATVENEEDLSLDDAFAELIEMAEKIDAYYEEHGISG